MIDGGAFHWTRGQRALRFGPSWVWRDTWGRLWDEVDGVCSPRGGRLYLPREDLERTRGPLELIGGAR